MNPDDLKSALLHALGMGPAPQPQPAQPPARGSLLAAALGGQPATQPDATSVYNQPRNLPPMRSVGPVTKGNISLPEATYQSQYRPRYDKAMSMLADALPVIGDARALAQAGQSAKQGHYLAAALGAAGAAVPMGGRIGRVAEEEAARVAAPAARDAFYQGSKLVDEGGNPLTLYHGTTKNFDQFKTGHAPGWGDGIYFTDNPTQAAEEFGAGPNGRVIRAHVAIRNPYNGDGPIPKGVENTQAWRAVAAKWNGDVQDAWQEDSKFVGNALRELGYDGIVAHGSNSIDGREVIAFTPEQIRILDHGRKP
jgi:hypothetical protein